MEISKEHSDDKTARTEADKYDQLEILCDLSNIGALGGEQFLRKLEEANIKITSADDLKEILNHEAIKQALGSGSLTIEYITTLGSELKNETNETTKHNKAENEIIKHNKAKDKTKHVVESAIIKNLTPVAIEEVVTQLSNTAGLNEEKITENRQIALNLLFIAFREDKLSIDEVKHLVDEMFGKTEEKTKKLNEEKPETAITKIDDKPQNVGVKQGETSAAGPAGTIKAADPAEIIKGKFDHFDKIKETIGLVLAIKKMKENVSFKSFFSILIKNPLLGLILFIKIAVRNNREYNDKINEIVRIGILNDPKVLKKATKKNEYYEETLDVLNGVESGTRRNIMIEATRWGETSGVNTMQISNTFGNTNIEEEKEKTENQKTGEEGKESKLIYTSKEGTEESVIPITNIDEFDRCSLKFQETYHVMWTVSGNEGKYEYTENKLSTEAKLNPTGELDLNKKLSKEQFLIFKKNEDRLLKAWKKINSPLNNESPPSKGARVVCNT